METKILILGWGIPPNIEGGLDIHTYRLFNNLRDLGVKVDLAVFEDYIDDEEEGIIGLETSSHNVKSKYSEISGKVAEISKNYDIIHTHDWFGAEPGFKSMKHSNCKWITTFHSLSSERSRDSIDDLEKLERIAAKNSDKVIAVSNQISEKIGQKFGVSSTVIHNGVSEPDSTGEDIRQKHDIQGEMVFFVGRHAEQKGLKHLIYGFSKYQENNNATLVIGGKGHLTDSLKQFVELLGLNDQVVFTGFIDEKMLGDYYQEADVFVSPSINEPFGITVVEAAESGTPIAATECGAEEILPEKAVHRVETNSESIKNGIEKAIGTEMPDYSSRTWKQVAEETIEIYRSLN